MTDHPRAPVPQITDSIDIGRYTLHTAVEIGFVLRNLTQRQDFVSVYMPGGHSFLTTVLDSDSKTRKLALDWGSVEALNEMLLRSDRAVCVAAPEGVKTQFVLTQVGRGQFEGHPAFIAAFPSDVVKLQRREFYRVDTPIGRPLKVRIAQADGDPLEYALHDLSLGGLAFWQPQQAALLPVGAVYPRCRLDLGPFGVLMVDIEIRSQREIEQKNGVVQRMVGCAFLASDLRLENLLQRYIAQLERERNLLR